MSIVIVTPVTSRTVALSTTRVHASLLSELVCEVFNFTTQHHEVVLLLLHRGVTVLGRSRIDKGVLDEIYHRGLIDLMLLQRTLSSASPNTVLCVS